MVASTDGSPGRHGPGVLFPPPLLLALAFLTGWVIEHRVRPMPVTDDAAMRPALETVGGVLLAAGLFVTFWGMWTFRQARTSVMPHRPAARLVIAGPYRFTRNPMYIGLSTAYVGLAVMANTLWPVLFLPIALWLLYALVIRREERYLVGEFGEEYQNYRRRVRRWL